MPRLNEEAKEAGRQEQLEDKAQRMAEHFPINAAGGENRTAHSNTGKMRVKVQ